MAGSSFQLFPLVILGWMTTTTFLWDALVEPIMVIFKVQQITIATVQLEVNFATLKTVFYTDARHVCIRHACSRHAIFPLGLLWTSAESTNLLAFYSKYRSLIGYATRYLFNK